MQISSEVSIEEIIRSMFKLNLKQAYMYENEVIRVRKCLSLYL